MSVVYVARDCKDQPKVLKQCSPVPMFPRPKFLGTYILRILCSSELIFPHNNFAALIFSHTHAHVVPGMYTFSLCHQYCTYRIGHIALSVTVEIGDDLHGNWPNVSEAHLNWLLSDMFGGLWSEQQFNDEPAASVSICMVWETTANTQRRCGRMSKITKNGLNSVMFDYVEHNIIIKCNST